MTTIDRQVQRTRNRLWLALWLATLSKLITVAAVAVAAAVIVVRLGSWTLPWAPIIGGLFAFVFIVSIVWSWQQRPGVEEAATALDQAANLRERVSSSLFLAGNTDPFAQAVVADAAQWADRITVRQHVRLRPPGSAPWAGGAIVLAALAFLVPEGLLAREKEKSQRQDQAAVAMTRVNVQKQLDDIKKVAQTNPALADLKADLDKLDALPKEKMERAEDIRRDALKKIDKLADAVREKQENPKYDRVSETQKMMRALQEPPGPKTEVQKLARDLKQGDFKSAQETIKQLQEQLATLKKDGDKEFAEKMQKQLDDLAKQLEKAGNLDELAKKLEQAGLKKEDAERLLQRLSKEDLQKIREQLEKSGLTQQQIDKFCQQCQKKQGASQAAKQMAQAMSKAAQAAGQGDGQESSASMEQASDQLSELEALEQEKNQLESAMAQLDQSRGQCSGNKPGQGQGDGAGQGNGGMGENIGQGRGGLAPLEQTATAFKIERAKVETTKGKIIGQFLVDGEQIKGEATEEFTELIAAAERDATDSIERSRVPRQYHKALREYFARLPGNVPMPPIGAEASPAGNADGQPAPGATEGAAPDPAAEAPAAAGSNG